MSFKVYIFVFTTALALCSGLSTPVLAQQTPKADPIPSSTPTTVTEPGEPAISEPPTAGPDAESAELDTQTIPPVKESDIPVEPKEQTGAPGEQKPVRLPPAEPKAASPSKGTYSRPLLFAPEDNNIQFTSPQIKWDMAKGLKINLGGLIFGVESLKMTLDQLKRDDVPRRYRESGRDSSLTTNLSFRWPDMLTRTGTLTVETQQGKVLWTTEVDDDARESWTSALSRDDDKLLKSHTKASFAVLDADTSKANFLSRSGRIRFCLSRAKDDKEKIRICSNLHELSHQGEKIQLRSIDEQTKGLVEVGGEEIGPRGIVNFPSGKDIELKVRFADGSFIALSSRPIVLRFLDTVFSKDGTSIILTGQGAKPIGKVKDLDVPPNHFWSATGFEREIIWQVTIPRNVPTIRVFGAWHVPFAYLIKHEDMPSEDDRIYISTRTGSGTYVGRARIRAYSPAGRKLQSKEVSVKRNSKTDTTWYFQARQRGVNNKARLITEDRESTGGQWVAHYQLYRGYPYELSARLTGIVAADLQTVLIGEVAASNWFERAFGADSYYLSEKRWGLSARYFRALQSFAFSSDTVTLDQFSVVNIDLKYNIIPGIWNRDELFGLIVSTELINIAGLKANLGGVGAYWARTMPKFLDDFFNLLPFMRYPKYVDVEFIYYPLALSPDVEAGTSYNLNFHGKVFWTKQLYGEAGFGTKQFNYIQKAAASDVAVGTAYGTIGLGFVF